VGEGQFRKFVKVVELGNAVTELPLHKNQNDGPKTTTRSPSEDEMGPRVNALYGGVRIAEK